jgi:putative transposase
MKRLKDVEEENARLKRMYANLVMDNEVLRDLITKKVWAPTQRDKPCHQLKLSKESVRNYGLLVNRACKMLSLSRSQFYYTSKKDDQQVIEASQGKTSD